MVGNVNFCSQCGQNLLTGSKPRPASNIRVDDDGVDTDLDISAIDASQIRITLDMPKPQVLTVKDVMGTDPNAQAPQRPHQPPLDPAKKRDFLKSIAEECKSRGKSEEIEEKD